MSPLVQMLPPGRLWIEVTDLPSALLALELLWKNLRSADDNSALQERDQV